MEAILEATARDTFGKNEARRTRREGKVPAVRLRRATASSEATPIAVAPKALLKILHSESGAEHADLAEARRRRRHAGAGQGLPARPGHARSCCTPTSTASRWTRCCRSRSRSSSRASRRASSSRAASSSSSAARSRSSACRPTFPEHVEVDVSELMLHQGVRVRDIATNPKWKPVSDPDMMLVHVIMPKAEEVAGAGRSGGGGDRDGGRARSHQEGQEGRGEEGRQEEEGREEEVAATGDRLRVKADRRARQSGREVPRARGTTSASRCSTSWRGAPAVEFESRAGRGADGAVAADATTRAARQAADVHEPQRRGGRRAARGTSRSSRPICWWSSTKCSCRSASCGRGRADRRAGTTG